MSSYIARKVSDKVNIATTAVVLTSVAMMKNIDSTDTACKYPAGVFQLYDNLKVARRNPVNRSRNEISSKIQKLSHSRIR